MKKKYWYDVWTYRDGGNECISRGVEAYNVEDAILTVSGERQLGKTGRNFRGRMLYAGWSGKLYLANKLPRHPSEMFIPV